MDMFRRRQILNFSQDFQQNTFPARLEPFQSCSRSIFYSLWHHGDVQNSKILSTLTMYRLSFFVLSWGILHWNLWDFDPNRIWTHRDQFSTDFCAWGLCSRRRHSMRSFSSATSSRRSTKTVWVDQVVSGDLVRTHLRVITRGTLWVKINSKRTLEASMTTSFGRIVRARSLAVTWRPPEPQNSQKWVS